MLSFSAPKSLAPPFNFNRASGFTLVELIVVIVIVTILSLMVVAYLNPLEIRRQARDAVRVESLEHVNAVVKAAVQNKNQSTEEILCANEPGSLPCFGRSSDYNSAQLNGTGWTKIDFPNVQLLSDLVSLATLPVDPINSGKNIYTYCSDGKDWEINTRLESKQYNKYQINENDGGDQNDVYELGTNLKLINNTSSTCTDPGICPNGPCEIASINLPLAQLRAITVNPVTNKIYATSMLGSGRVFVIDGATNSVVGSSINVGASPLGIAVNPVTNKIYVTSLTGRTVSVIDGNTNSVIKTINTGGGSSYPFRITVNPITNKVFFSLVGSTSEPPVGGNRLGIIDGATDTMVTTVVSGGATPWGVAVNTTTNKVYLQNRTSSNVSVFDGNSPFSLGTTTTTAAASLIGVNSLTNKAYVTVESSNQIVKFDAATNTIEKTTDLGANIRPFAIAVNPNTNHVFIGNNPYPGINASFSVINGSTNTLIKTDGIGPSTQISDAAVNTSTNRVYMLLMNPSYGTIKVIQD